MKLKIHKNPHYTIQSITIRSREFGNFTIALYERLRLTDLRFHLLQKISAETNRSLSDFFSYKLLYGYYRDHTYINEYEILSNQISELWLTDDGEEENNENNLYCYKHYSLSNIFKIELFPNAKKSIDEEKQKFLKTTDEFVIGVLYSRNELSNKGDVKVVFSINVLEIENLNTFDFNNKGALFPIGIFVVHNKQHKDFYDSDLPIVLDKLVAYQNKISFCLSITTQENEYQAFTELLWTNSISVIIRALPSGEEIEVNLPAKATGQQIIETFLDFDEINVPRCYHEGYKILYRLSSKYSGKEIKPYMSLSDANIKDGDFLILSVVLD